MNNLDEIIKKSEKELEEEYKKIDKICEFNSNKVLKYIHANGAKATIPSKRNAKIQRSCDWWLYKERHLVEKLFLKLKAYRRIATRYDKLACTYLGFLCLASILIWLK